MVFSPALAHRQRRLAQQAAIAAGHATAEGAAPPIDADNPANAEYQQLLARLHDDLRALHQIQSRETRSAKKAEMLNAYLPWIEGALAATDEGQAPQDEIVVTGYIWAVDTLDWGLALRLGEHVARHALQLPERFHRTVGGFLISQIADAAIDNPGSVDHDQLAEAMALLSASQGPAWDMKDETRARLHRALGESWSRRADAFDPNADSAEAGGKPALVDAALTELTRATELDPKVGVKKQIEALEREAKKLAAAAAAGQN